MKLPSLCLLLLPALPSVCVCAFTSGSGSSGGDSSEFQESDVRLVGGRTEREGMVEVFLEGQWGTVCDDQWDDRDAEVVCRQLGFLNSGQLTYAVKRAGNVFGGEGSGPIHMDEVFCLGKEEKLGDCGYEKEHDCTHAQDAGVICPGNCTNGDIRLVDGYDENEGRLEICYGGLWGTVCDDNLDTSEATVVCQQLGLLERNIIPLGVGQAYFGEGMGLILLDELDCDGRESYVSNCSHNEITEHDCKHSEDVGVFCKGGRENCSDGDVCLVGGQDEREGVVQICYKGVWGTECSKRAYYHEYDIPFLQNDNNANVLCRQLGFLEPNRSTFSVWIEDYAALQGPILLENVKCEGDEDKFTKCHHAGIGTHSCFNPASPDIICPGNCTHGSVQVVGSQNRKEGRVEACFEGHWFPVYHDGWSDREAKVVCRQLQLSSSSSPVVAVAGDMYGEAEEGLRWSVHCNGDESSLDECTVAAEYSDSHDTAGVICQVNCRDETIHSSLNKNQRNDICKVESESTHSEALATAISLPLVAILAVLVVIMILLIVLVRRRKNHFEHIRQSCTTPLPSQDNIEAELSALKNTTAVSKSGHKKPQVLVTNFCNPMQSLPHTYESMRGRNIWLSSPKDVYLEEADSMDNLAGDCVDSDTAGGHAYAILEKKGVATFEHPGHAKSMVEATTSDQCQMNEQMETIDRDLSHVTPSYDRLERPAKNTAESAAKESDGTGVSPSKALELGAGERPIDIPTEKSLGYDSLKPLQHLAELSIPSKGSSESENIPPVGAQGEGGEGGASSIGNSIDLLR